MWKNIVLGDIQFWELTVCSYVSIKNNNFGIELEWLLNRVLFSFQLLSVVRRVQFSSEDNNQLI